MKVHTEFAEFAEMGTAAQCILLTEVVALAQVAL